VRDRFTRQGFLVYGVKAKGGGLSAGINLPGSRKRLNLEKFLIFNQQSARTSAKARSCLTRSAPRKSSPKST
jgi:hypothetical protein